MSSIRRIQLVQHCQSKHHLDQSIKDREDKYNGLTDLGRNQAVLTSKRLKSQIPDPSAYSLFSSDQQRAKETAIIVSDVLDIQIHYYPGLREWIGDLEIYGLKNFERTKDQNVTRFDWSPFIKSRVAAESQIGF